MKEMTLQEATNVIAELRLSIVGHKRVAESQAARHERLGWKGARDKRKRVEKCERQIEALTLASAALGVVQLSELEEAEVEKAKRLNGKKLSYNLQTRRTEELPAGARR